MVSAAAVLGDGAGAEAGWWSARGALARRLRWVRDFRRIVAAHEGELCGLMEREIGKSRWEGLTADVLPLLAACRWLERHAGRVLRERRLRGGAFWQIGERHRVVREPLGDVAIIATWNYPVQLLGIQLVQALAAGNRVVVKPSEHSPRTQVRLLELATAAGLPAGVLGWVEATREAGRDLLAGRRFDHVVFTGSTSVGRAVAAWAAETMTPTTLELSGRDSAIVLADADAALAARAIWHGVTANAGQTCMAPRRVLVEEGAYERVLAALAPLAAGARPVRLISAAAERAYGLALGAVRAGGRSLSGVMERPCGEQGEWLRPLAIVDCPAGCELVAGDHFGPVVAVSPVGSVEEALAVHRACAQHLAVSVFTQDAERIEGLVGELGASNVVVNDCVRPVGHPGVCLGGRGMSGWGVTRGEEGLLAMTRAVCVSRTGRVLRPPYTEPARGIAERVAGFARWWYGAGRAREVAGAKVVEREVGVGTASGACGTERNPPPCPLPQGGGGAGERSA